MAICGSDSVMSSIPFASCGKEIAFSELPQLLACLSFKHAHPSFFIPHTHVTAGYKQYLWSPCWGVSDHRGFMEPTNQPVGLHCQALGFVRTLSQKITWSVTDKVIEHWLLTSLCLYTQIEEQTHKDKPWEQTHTHTHLEKEIHIDNHESVHTHTHRGENP